MCPLGVAAVPPSGSERLAGSPCSVMAWRSCAVRLPLIGGASRSSVRGGRVQFVFLSSRWPRSLQQSRGFRKPRKAREEPGPPRTELPESLNGGSGGNGAPPGSPRAFGRLVKPLAFTVGFTGCSFGLAAIWQYESLKGRAQSYLNGLQADWLGGLRPQKRGNVRRTVNLWWHSLSEGQRTVSAIVAANAVVFCCWRVPSLQRTMIKYFTANPASKTLCAPMLLSTFSHRGVLHLSTNMLVLWSFSTSAVSMLGQEQFVAVYLSAGVLSSLVSYVWKTASGRLGSSLGASGAVMAVLAAVCTGMPEVKLAIVLLPIFTFSGASALKAIVAMDTAGMVLGWKLFDHAAHLGGAVFGIWYVLSGQEVVWKNRKPLVEHWHNLRTRGGRGGGGAGDGGAGIERRG
ncbi:presenilin-associated rhomboid-like protein, mitochondrial [Brachionichthys hirsutus]|uniref:presenilin-associated rhomboid-like protein, mitochondrial n=1 Tax=Brachionichthys hirsutus TaxID=412623 RepID=UPI003604C5DB